jgi:uncharacterized protein (TIGR02391 family)
MVWNRSKTETLGLPINALALLILEDYKAAGEWNSGNWIIGSQHHGTAGDREIRAGLEEGWGWLIAHGLVVRDHNQSAAERLGVALHPRIAEQVEQQFLLGEYELAVFAAMREVEIRVRQLAAAPDSLLGVKLMKHAFSAQGPRPLVDPNADGGEKEAAMFLFAGAIGLFKNPTSRPRSGWQ